MCSIAIEVKCRGQYSLLRGKEICKKRSSVHARNAEYWTATPNGARSTFSEAINVPGQNDALQMNYQPLKGASEKWLFKLMRPLEIDFKHPHSPNIAHTYLSDPFCTFLRASLSTDLIIIVIVCLRQNGASVYAEGCRIIRFNSHTKRIKLWIMERITRIRHGEFIFSNKRTVPPLHFSLSLSFSFSAK